MKYYFAVFGEATFDRFDVVNMVTTAHPFVVQKLQKDKFFGGPTLIMFREITKEEYELFLLI